MHHSIGYTSSNAISLFLRNLVKNTTFLPTARHFRLFVPTLIPSGSLYTNMTQIVPPEAKRHAHRESVITWEIGDPDILGFHSGLCKNGKQG